MLLKACRAFFNPLLEVMYLGRSSFKLSCSRILHTMSLFSSTSKCCKVLSSSTVNLLTVTKHFFYLRNLDCEEVPPIGQVILRSSLTTIASSSTSVEMSSITFTNWSC
jgi:hypothetical protein